MEDATTVFVIFLLCTPKINVTLGSKRDTVAIIYSLFAF